MKNQMYKPSLLRCHDANGEIYDNYTHASLELFQSISSDSRYPYKNAPRWESRFNVAANFTAHNFLDLNQDWSKCRALEIGCGNGSKSVALAPLFGEYVGFDIESSRIRDAQTIAKIGNLDSLNFEVASVSNMRGVLERSGPFDVVFLIAIIEHLTPEERLETLSLVWSLLKPGGYIYLGETPNRLAPADHHSFGLPYLDQLPEEFALRYLDTSPRKDMVERVQKADDSHMELYRTGRGASYHEFELSIMDITELNQHVCQDGYLHSSLNVCPLRVYEFFMMLEYQYMQAWQSRTNFPKKIPPMFARNMMEGLISKNPAPSELEYPSFVENAVLDNKPVSLTRWVSERRQAYGFPFVELSGKNNLLQFNVELSTNSGLLSFFMHRESSGILQISIDDKLKHELNIDEILSKQMPYWHEYCALSINLDSKNSELKFTNKSTGSIRLQTFLSRGQKNSNVIVDSAKRMGKILPGLKAKLKG